MNRLKITIDTREQQPWGFFDMADVQRGKLDAGDYALAGDSGFAIERKGLDDFIQTITRHKDRFQRELERMENYPVKIVIVEADWKDIIHHKYNSEIKPPFILRLVSELTMDGVVILFGSDPISSAGLCWRILKEREKRLNEEIF